MTQRWDTQKHGGFKLTKVLFVRRIELDDYLMMKFDVQITGSVALGSNAKSAKSNIVHIVPVQREYAALNKAQKEQGKAVRGPMQAREPVPNHFKALCGAMREALRDKVL